MKELKHLVDNGTNYVTVSHIIKSDYFGNKGRDLCLEYFGEEDEECREHNRKFDEKSVENPSIQNNHSM